MSNNIVLDCETSALPLEKLQAVMPSFKASGVLKDPAKIEADITAKRDEWIDSAALSALTGEIVAIGIMTEAGKQILIQDEANTEADILKAAWKSMGDVQFPKIIGHNVKAFDLPYMIRRSWAVGVVPMSLLKGRYFDSCVADTMEAWACGTRDMISLDNLSKFLGVGFKTQGVSGKDFAKLLRGSSDERAKALEYLNQDLALTWLCAERMGLIR